MVKRSLDKREVRSFRLRYFTLDLSCFLKQKESFGLFMLCDSLQPKDRQKWSEEFNKKNFKVTFVSKNILKFVFFKTKWVEVRNLLQGGVVLIRDKLNKVIKKENLNFLLTEKKFFFRLLFWQYILCRSYLMYSWLKKEDENLKSFFQIIKLFMLNKKTSLYIKF